MSLRSGDVRGAPPRTHTRPLLDPYANMGRTGVWFGPIDYLSGGFCGGYLSIETFRGIVDWTKPWPVGVTSLVGLQMWF